MTLSDEILELADFTLNACKLHADEGEATYDSSEQDKTLAYCPNCGTMLHTYTCPDCGGTFIDWISRGFDDIMAAPMVTMAGDVCCERCYDEDEDQFGDQEEYEEEYA